MPKYENHGKKIHFYEKITRSTGKKLNRNQPGHPLMRLNPLRQIHFRHLMIVILKLMDTQRLVNMSPVFPVPNLKIGEIPILGHQHPERTMQIFSGAVGLNLLFKPELH